MKTLSDLTALKCVRISGEEMILSADKNLFENILKLEQGKKLHMEKKYWYILLANPSGSLRKTKKSELKRSLEQNSIM